MPAGAWELKSAWQTLPLLLEYTEGVAFGEPGVSEYVTIPWRSIGDGQARARAGRFVGVRGRLQGQDVRDRATDVLLGKGEVSLRQTSRVQCIAKRTDPALVECLKQARIDAGSLVNRHGAILPMLGRE